MKGRGLLTIRVSKNTLSFTTLDTTNLDEPIVYEPYTIKSGISMAANLREAFKETTAVSRTAKAQVLLDAKVLMIPIEQFQESDIEKYYFHTFPQDNQLSVTYNVLPEFNSVAVFAINKDVRLVLRDNVSGATAIHLMAPVWHYLHTRSFTGHRQKLYGYFHDKQLEIFSFQQNRFKFCNNFDVSQPRTRMDDGRTEAISSECVCHQPHGRVQPCPCYRVQRYAFRSHDNTHQGEITPCVSSQEYTRAAISTFLAHSRRDLPLTSPRRTSSTC